VERKERKVRKEIFRIKYKKRYVLLVFFLYFIIFLIGVAFTIPITLELTYGFISEDIQQAFYINGIFFISVFGFAGFFFSLASIYVMIAILFREPSKIYRNGLFTGPIHRRKFISWDNIDIIYILRTPGIYKDDLVFITRDGIKASIGGANDFLKIIEIFVKYSPDKVGNSVHDYISYRKSTKEFKTAESRTFDMTGFLNEPKFINKGKLIFKLDKDVLKAIRLNENRTLKRIAIVLLIIALVPIVLVPVFFNIFAEMVFLIFMISGPFIIISVFIFLVWYNSTQASTLRFSTEGIREPGLKNAYTFMPYRHFSTVTEAKDKKGNRHYTIHHRFKNSFNIKVPASIPNIEKRMRRIRKLIRRVNREKKPENE